MASFSRIMQGAVTHNEARHRYELVVDGVTAYAEYEPRGDSLVFTHTIVPDEIGGRGVGGDLVRGALDAVRERGATIVAQCSFVAAFIERHPEYKDLVAATR